MAGGEVGWDDGGDDDFRGDPELFRKNFLAQTCFPLMENLAFLLPSRTTSILEGDRVTRRAYRGCSVASFTSCM